MFHPQLARQNREDRRPDYAPRSMQPAGWEAKLTYRLDATFRAGIAAASSLRSMGATRVPRISMACSILSCGSVETPIWNVMREIPPRTFIVVQDFFRNRFGIADEQCAGGPAHGVELRSGGLRPTVFLADLGKRVRIPWIKVVGSLPGVQRVPWLRQLIDWARTPFATAIAHGSTQWEPPLPFSRS